jgi:hypothetical protein
LLWSPNLQLHYPFQNQANDYSGNARHGTVNGSGVYADKPNGGRCLYFDGTGDYVATPSFGLSGTVVVFAGWMRVKAYAAIQGLGLLAGTRLVQFMRAAGSSDFIVQYYNGASYINATVSGYWAGSYNDSWLHMGFCFDSGNAKLYVYQNAVAIAPISLTTPVFPSGAAVKTLGSLGGSSYALTAGYLANVQLWTLATMPAAAQMLANANRIMLGMNPIW